MSAVTKATGYAGITTPVPPAGLMAGLAVDNDGFASLQAIGVISKFSRNETIFAEGDEAQYAYKVVSGAVRLCKLMCDGRRQVATFLLPGDFFGFEWCGTHCLTAEALSDTTIVRYARTRLDRLGEERVEVRRRLMSLISRDLWSAQNHVLMLGRQTAKERVASFFLDLAERQAAGGGDSLTLPMGRQDIADYLGLTIETVCRAISELKRSRIIEVPNRHAIVLRNISALRAAAETEN